jgi:zinc transporter ZupT
VIVIIFSFDGNSCVQVLEAGIGVHSVLIGIALGVSKTACALIPLLIALVFHQLFEGFALGACLVEVRIHLCWILVLFAGHFRTLVWFGERRRYVC